MKTSFLIVLGVFSIFVNLSLAAPQAYATSQPQQLSLPQPIHSPAEPSTMSPEWVIPVPSVQSNGPSLFDLVQELHAFPVGKKYSYYRQVLEQQGYIVLANFNDDRHWEFDLEKMKQNLRLTIAHNGRTGHGTAITASGPRIADAEYRRR